MSRAEQVEAVRNLSDALVFMVSSASVEVATIALVDAAVRIVGASRPDMTTPDVCRELARTVEKMGDAR